MMRITEQRIISWLLFIIGLNLGLFAQTIVQERRCQIDEVFQIFDRQYYCYEVEPVEEPESEDLRLMQVWHGRL